MQKAPLRCNIRQSSAIFPSRKRLPPRLSKSPAHRRIASRTTIAAKKLPFAFSFAVAPMLLSVFSWCHLFFILSYWAEESSCPCCTFFFSFLVKRFFSVKCFRFSVLRIGLMARVAKNRNSTITKTSKIKWNRY